MTISYRLYIIPCVGFALIFDAFVYSLLPCLALLFFSFFLSLLTSDDENLSSFYHLIKITSILKSIAVPIILCFVPICYSSLNDKKLLSLCHLKGIHYIFQGYDQRR